ncbi:DUF6313 family protein [Streptomyces triculaminicus]|uniref:DUF6313 family protein n=1 Tax=Streptomyces triculaminicus TaxID=2816232 RepID=UPI0033F573BA
MPGRRVAALDKFPHWLVVEGSIVIGLISGWYCIAWSLLGWSDAWDLLVGRATPRNAPYPWLSWPLSVIGWIAVPAFVGGAVGYLVTSHIDERRGETEDGFAEKAAARAREGGHE